MIWKHLVLVISLWHIFTILYPFWFFHLVRCASIASFHFSLAIPVTCWHTCWFSHLCVIKGHKSCPCTVSFKMFAFCGVTSHTFTIHILPFILLQCPLYAKMFCMTWSSVSMYNCIVYHVCASCEIWQLNNASSFKKVHYCCNYCIDILSPSQFFNQKLSSVTYQPSRHRMILISPFVGVL
jgi:hypothetical protein